MAGVFPSETLIFIADADTAGSAGAVAANGIVGEIRNFKVSGMEQENEVKNVFGGQIEIEKPRTKGEISFDISVSNAYASSLERWDLMKFPTGTSADETVGKAVFIQHSTGGKYLSIAINNAKTEVGETEMNADEELTKSVTLRFNAVTEAGVANLRTSAVAASTGFFVWS